MVGDNSEGFVKVISEVLDCVDYGEAFEFGSGVVLLVFVKTFGVISDYVLFFSGWTLAQDGADA